MRPNHEAALRSFKEGEFLAVIRSSPQALDDRRKLEPIHRVTLAHALALAGNLSEGRDLAQLDREHASDSGVRSQAASALALVSWRQGDLHSALAQAQAAVHLAHESKDLERTVWAHLYRFRLVIEGGPIDKVFGLLPDVRRIVAKAGVGQAAAYLHTCVSALEGQVGRFDEARRHCDIADSLLELYPSAWVAAASLLNRGCVACVSCDFDTATHLLGRAFDAAKKSGHGTLTLAAQTTLGHVQLITGQFEKAKNTLSTVINDPGVAVGWKLGAADGLARVYLALGELDKCEQVLERGRKEIEQHNETASIYHVRWSAVTQARLHLRHGLIGQALSVLGDVEKQASFLGDQPLAAVAQLIAAQAWALNKNSAESARLLLRALERGITGISELQPQYYYCAGMVIGVTSPLGQHLRNRAVRVWSDQSVVSIPREIDAGFVSETTPIEPLASSANIHSGVAQCLASSVAAAFDLGARPRLLGAEVLSAIEILGCSPEAKIVETRSATEPNGSDNVAVLPLGNERNRKLTLVCKISEDPVQAMALGDMLRIARAALALDRLRQDERNRAAIWPPTPVEEQAGALFLSDEMRSLLSTVRRIATTNVPVLITGETGTGKEVLARVIHAYSARASVTFLPFNCSGVPKDMLDSQLFGHRRGAFTGAIDSFPGVIRSAAGGTLFLDEIGETTLDVQPKLLRFLESSEVHPIGETQPLKVDVRVIAATNADLDALVAQGRFREDLFYRLNIVRLHVPPLRERRVEIPALASHYLQKHAQEYRKGELRLAEETMEYLVLYRWPGNVRQLANEMRRMAALAEAGAVLMPEHLSPEIAASRRTIPASDRALDPTELVVRVDQPVAAAIQHLERVMIQYALNTCGGRMEDTAAMLGLSRKGLYLKRLRYGLETPESAAAEVA